jgi:hypothetical protein
MSAMITPIRDAVLADSRIFAADSPAFRDQFNREPFAFTHQLADHPLFDLPRLATLAQTLIEKGPENVRWQVSDAGVDEKWNVPSKGQGEGVSEAIANLDRSGSWVLLYRVQNDPEYKAMLDSIMAELETVTGRTLGPDVTWKDAYIFMASPHAVTPYHIDHESTFLFQIHGHRLANIWNPDDRSVLTDTEIEDYYNGNVSAADYREENQSKAHVFEMAQGTGVHHPVRSPHWFKNGETYSIALGVHFCLREYDKEARIYQVNGWLRRFGLRPKPPGRSRWSDRAKMSIVGLFAKRSPKNKFELLRSGISRLTSPIRLAQTLKKKLVRR